MKKITSKIKNAKDSTFNKFWNIKNLKLRLLFIFLGAIICTISIQYCIIPAATVPTEVMGVTMGVTSMIFVYNTQNYKILFWGLYLAALIPFIIFGYFKVGKKFSLLTLLFSVLTTIAGQILTITHFLEIKSFDDVWLRVLFATIGSGLYGTGLAINLVCGSSSGGTDFLAAYFSVKKKQKIFKWLMFFAIFTLVLASFMFQVVGIQIKIYQKTFSTIDWNDFLLTFAISVWQCIFGPILLNMIYPGDKQMKLTFNTSLENDIHKAIDSKYGKGVLFLSTNEVIVPKKHQYQIKETIKQIDTNSKIESRKYLEPVDLQTSIWD